MVPGSKQLLLKASLLKKSLRNGPMFILQSLSNYRNTNLAHLAIWNIGLFESKAGPISLHFLMDGAMDHQLCAIHSVTGGPWIHFFLVGEFYPQIQATGRCKMDAEYQLVNFSEKNPPKTATRRCFWFSQKSPDIFTWLRTNRTTVFSMGFPKTYIFERFLRFSSPDFFRCALKPGHKFHGF